MNSPLDTRKTLEKKNLGEVRASTLLNQLTRLPLKSSVLFFASGKHRLIFVYAFLFVFGFFPSFLLKTKNHNAFWLCFTDSCDDSNNVQSSWFSTQSWCARSSWSTVLFKFSCWNVYHNILTKETQGKQSSRTIFICSSAWAFQGLSDSLPAAFLSFLIETHRLPLPGHSPHPAETWEMPSSLLRKQPRAKATKNRPKLCAMQKLLPWWCVS